MKNQEITIQEYANHFGLIWLNGDMNAMKRMVTEPTINRPGLELACFFDHPRSRRLVFLGNTEMAYIHTMSEENICRAFDFLMNQECPGIIICNNLECPSIIIQLALERNFPMFQSNLKTNDLLIETMTYLNEALAPVTSLHGTLMEIFSVGVVIMGASGIGKSETALELIKKGHHMISDDRVDIRLTRGHNLLGKSPELLKNMMEVRGIGIIDISKMFGVNTIRDEKNVELIIQLTSFDDRDDYERLGSKTEYQDILGVKVPIISIPVSGARSIGDIIEVAVTNYKLKKNGYDSTHEFEERLNELLRRKD